MPKQPSNSEQILMTRLGFKTLEEMEEWLNKPMDPALEDRFLPVYIPDEEEEEE